MTVISSHKRLSYPAYSLYLKGTFPYDTLHEPKKTSCLTDYLLLLQSC